MEKRLYAGEAKPQNRLGSRSVDATSAFLLDLAEPFFVTFENYAVVNFEKVKFKIGHEEIGFLHILSS